MFGMWSRPMVSADMKGWIDDCFEWFDGQFQPPDRTILPTKEFFSASKGNNEETAQRVVSDIAGLMHFDQPIEVLPLDTIAAEYRYSVQDLSEVAGTFQQTEFGAVIRYDPSLLDRPRSFINTMAHEVMHARLSGLEDEVPGGQGAHELATDLGCIIAGFGVFQLQAADDMGWSGYMSQNSRAVAQATFLARRDQSAVDLKPFLSARCYKLLTKAVREVDASDR